MDNPFKRMRLQTGYNFAKEFGSLDSGYAPSMFDHVKDGSEKTNEKPRYLPGFSAELQERRNQEDALGNYE